MKNQRFTAFKADYASALEARLALRLVGSLNLAVERLPHDIGERLRFGREKALAVARTARQPAAAVAPVVARAGAAAVLGGPPTLSLRLASLMPLIVLVAGLILIQKHFEREQIIDAAEVDAALLADDLPPAAYRDPGFAVFLQSQDAD